MKPLERFWNEKYGLDGSLEADSWIRSRWNKHVVAALMNAFPKAATNG